MRSKHLPVKQEGSAGKYFTGGYCRISVALTTRRPRKVSPLQLVSAAGVRRAARELLQQPAAAKQPTHMEKHLWDDAQLISAPPK